MYIKSASPKSMSELDIAFGWKAPGSEIDLRDMVQELQGIRVGLCDGGSASALLEVQGSGGESKTNKISTSDVIFGNLLTKGKGGTSGISGLEMTADLRIAATAGYVSVSSATTGQQLVVFWLDKTGYSAY